MLKDEFLFGVNAGGPEYTDLLGNLYQADTYGVGKTYSTTSGIAATEDDLLYQSETWQSGGFTYDVAVADGTYYVELNYAEIYGPIDTTGERVFDVSIEGALIEDNFDVVATAGAAYTAYVEGYFVEVIDGALTLTFSSEVQNPKLNAFSVWSVTSDGSDTTAPVVDIAYSGAQSPSEDLTVVVTYSDDTALDTATIDTNELTASGAGTYAVTYVDLVFSSADTIATATYTVSQQDGWTGDPVTLTVAAGEAADTTGNTNLEASTTFEFTGTTDTTAPLVEITYSGGQNPGEALNVIVTYSDETALDTSTIGTAELQASGTGLYTVTFGELLVAADDKSATASYTVFQDGGWTSDPVTLTVAADEVADMSSNTNVSASIAFQFSDTTPPDVSITLSSVSDSQDPMTVTVTYVDDVALNPDTIQLSDLSIATAGPTVDILSSSLTTSTDGLSATATYSVLPQGGWTSDAVSFSVAAGAIEDSASNPNAAATQSYTFTEPSDTVVNSLSEMTQLALQGVNLNNPTSIDVGADGRLYVSQQNGLIVALTIEKTETFDSNGNLIVTWGVTAREDITLVQEMPNHSDQGVFESGVNSRQVTGIITTTDANGNVMLYVGSSDPRIGGGGSGNDKNLDTNSGVLSRLIQVDDGTGNLVWEKVDLVRGLPRSEENHSINGMQLATDPEGNEIILLNVGGFTNTGAQSNNFAYTPEYYYSAAVVGIDLTKLADLEATQGVKTYTPPGSSTSHDYLFDLPTLDDPSRENDANGGDLAEDGTTTADVFGGNDGLNQAIYDPSGIVTVLYSGFRNHYDIVVTPTGEVYTVDNGSNTGWGGAPVNAQGEVIVDSDGDGLANNGPAVNYFNDAGSQNADSLLRIDDDIWTADTEMYYGGHPNLYRALGAEAGFYLYASANNTLGLAAGTPLDYDETSDSFVAAIEPTDLGPLIPNADQIAGSLLDPQQQVLLGTDGRVEGKTDTPNGALYTFFSSTNGLDVVKSAGELNGALITVSFNGSIYALPLLADGTVDLANVQSRSLTSKPLDLVTQGDTDPYPGVIFVAAYGADQIVILSPDESQGVLPNPNDRDGDGIDDTIDPFAADPNNGRLDTIAPGDVLTWTFVNGETFPNDREALFDGTGGLYNGGDIGFTGIMTNRGGLPESLYLPENIIFGGAPGVLQVKSVDPGDATTETQRNGFQLGTTLGEGLEAFTVTSLIDNYLDELDGFPAEEKISQGIFLGAGDQNNFVAVALVKLADGRVGFEVTSQFAFDFVGETTPKTDFYEVSALATAGPLDTVTLGLDVNVATAEVTPTWTYVLGGDATSGSGTAVALAGDALAALEGTLTLPDNTGGQVPVGLAVGVVSSRSSDAVAAGGAVAAFSAGGDETFSANIDGTDITFVPDTSATNVTIVGTSKTYGVSETLDITNSELDELHTEERYAGSDADWGYAIATGDGTFLVDLYFAEIWNGAFAPGVRVFDVSVEGTLLADNYDIYQAAGGGNLETVLSTTVQVTDGTLDIAFSKEVQNAKVNAVLVRNADTNGTFAADWDNLEIRGFGTPPADLTAPTATLSIDDAVIADDAVRVTVTYSDNVALDETTIEQSDLTVTAAKPYQVILYDQVKQSDELVTATFDIKPDGGWLAGDEFIFEVTGGQFTDSAGNANAPSDAASFIFDIVAPEVTLSVSGGAFGTDPVIVVATYTDDVALDADTIDTSDLVISGATDANYVVLKETIELISPTEATVTYSILQDGGWTSDPVEFSIAAGAITDAKGQGNTAVSQTFTYTDDTTPTGQAPDLLATSDSGTSDSDDLTNDTTPTVRVALDATVAEGDEVELLLDGVSFATPVLTTVATTDLSNGHVDFTLTDGALGADGTKSLSARLTDTAGNSSDTAASLVTLDTTAPMIDIDPVTGDNQVDDAQDGAVVISGTTTGAADGQTVSLEIRDGTGTVFSGTATVISGIWNTTFDLSSLADGASYTVTADVSDAAGNPAVQASEVFQTVGTNTAPVIDIDPVTGDNQVDDAEDGAVKISGTTANVEDGQTVSVEIRDGTALPIGGTATVTGGAWSTTAFNLSGLADGASYTVTADVSDAAGTSAVQATEAFSTVDSTAPLAPLISSVGDDTGISASDAVTSDTTLVISGTAEAGSLVEVFLDAGSLGTTTADGSGAWSFDHTATVLAEGSYALTATARDAAGNGSGLSTPFALTVDTTAPVASLSVSGGTSTFDPVIVVASYTDAIGLAESTIEINDLDIAGATGATYTTLSETTTVSATEATITYEILQVDGWTADPVAFSVAAGAVTDTSGQGNAATSTTFEFTPEADNFVFAVNAGGSEFTDGAGVTYQADTFGAGKTYSTSSDILGTEDDPLYQTEAWQKGGFTYDIPVADGTYTVKMHFAEIYGPIDTIGERVFDVFLEDQLVVDNLDIFSEVGQYAAFTFEATVDVQDGGLTLTTSPEAENPKISGFSIWTADDMVA